MVRRHAVLLLVTILIGCGSSSSASLAPAEAVSGAPLAAWKKIVASDRNHLWMTDLDRLATYDRTTERWTVQDLPGAKNTVDQVVGSPVGGQLALIVSTCSGPCARMRENLDAIRVFRSTAAGLHEMALRNGPTSFGGIYVVRTTATRAMFRTPSADTTWLIDVGPRSTTATPSDTSLYLLCSTGTGFVAIESVKPDAAEAVPPQNIPDVGGGHLDALRVTAGPDLASMRPVQLVKEATQAMADRLRLAMACIPGGLALLRPNEAWELRDGAWSQKQATLSGTLYDVIEPHLVPIPDGSLVGAAIQRSTAGAWRNHDPLEQVAVMGQTVIRFRPGE
jgi:hypothetical protein